MNTRTDDFSDSLLGAFIDGELDPAEYSRVLKATQDDEALGARVCELRRLQDIVRHAYRNPPSPVARSPRQATRAPRIPNSIAAGLLVLTCVCVGWFAHDAYQQHMHTAQQPGEQSFMAARLDQSVSAGHNVLMHVNSGDSHRLATALDTAERIARDHHSKDDHVIILANDSGLNLLRADLSPYPARVESLLSAYPNITLIACRNAIEKLEHQTGTKVQLLPGARVGRPALEEIVSRLHEGWTYLKI